MEEETGKNTILMPYGERRERKVQLVLLYGGQERKGQYISALWRKRQEMTGYSCLMVEERG